MSSRNIKMAPYEKQAHTTYEAKLRAIRFETFEMIGNDWKQFETI